MRRGGQYRDVIAAYRNGQPVKLSEIANVIDDVENQLTTNQFNNEKSIVLAIYKQSHANTVKIVDSIYDRLPTYSDSGVGQDGTARRSLRLDSRLGCGRGGHAGHSDRARRPRDLPVPALGLSHNHSVADGADSLTATCAACTPSGSRSTI
jgi:AcrB/AcrD/AcrF family